jgi:predicted O-linked N-acetylglucosamine transferase (SPINDLY family)
VKRCRVNTLLWPSLSTHYALKSRFLRFGAAAGVLLSVLTLRGNRHAGRMCASILTRLGLSELIAESTPVYEALAVALAGDLDRLADLRGGLRKRMRGSPLCDGTAMTRCLEDAYRMMWQRWCDGAPSS